MHLVFRFRFFFFTLKSVQKLSIYTRNAIYLISTLVYERKVSFFLPLGIFGCDQQKTYIMLQTFVRGSPIADFYFIQNICLEHQLTS